MSGIGLLLSMFERARPREAPGDESLNDTFVPLVFV